MATDQSIAADSRVGAACATRARKAHRPDRTECLRLPRPDDSRETSTRNSDRNQPPVSLPRRPLHPNPRVRGIRHLPGGTSCPGAGRCATPDAAPNRVTRRRVTVDDATSDGRRQSLEHGGCAREARRGALTSPPRSNVTTPTVSARPLVAAHEAARTCASTPCPCVLNLGSGPPSRRQWRRRVPGVRDHQHFRTESRSTASTCGRRRPRASDYMPVRRDGRGRGIWLPYLEHHVVRHVDHVLSADACGFERRPASRGRGDATRHCAQ